MSKLAPETEGDVNRYPGSSDPAVREIIELLLPWHVRASFADLFPIYDVRDPESWPGHPDLRDFFERTALRVLKARGERRGLSATAALREGCERLRMNPEAARKQFRRSLQRFSNATWAWDVASPNAKKPALALPNNNPNQVRIP